MTEPPRRLPVTGEERTRIAVERAAGGSNMGGTRQYRRVTRPPTNPTVTGVSDSGFDRIALTWFVPSPATTLTGSGLWIPSWTVEEEAGDAVTLDVPSAQVYLNREGVYAANISINAVGCVSAAAACSILMTMAAGEGIAPRLTCSVRGGDADNGSGSWASASRTWHYDGLGAAGGLFSRVDYSNLDTVNITSVSFEMDVQKIG